MTIALTDREARAVARTLAGRPVAGDDLHVAEATDKFAAAFERLENPGPIPGQTTIHDYLEGGAAA